MFRRTTKERAAKGNVLSQSKRARYRTVSEPPRTPQVASERNVSGRDRNASDRRSTEGDPGNEPKRTEQHDATTRETPQVFLAKDEVLSVRNAVPNCEDGLPAESERRSRARSKRIDVRRIHIDTYREGGAPAPTVALVLVSTSNASWASSENSDLGYRRQASVWGAAGLVVSLSATASWWGIALMVLGCYC